MAEETERTVEEEEELAKLEEELKKLDSHSSPASKEEQGKYNFFHRVLASPKTIRLGNLNNVELAIIRQTKKISNYAAVEGLDLVARYINDGAEIVSETSMSKQGFWSKNFVTSKKVSEDVSNKPKKAGWFSKKDDEEK